MIPALLVVWFLGVLAWCCVWAAILLPSGPPDVDPFGVAAVVVAGAFWPLLLVALVAMGALVVLLPSVDDEEKESGDLP